MYDSIAVMLETFTIILVSHHIYVNKIRSSNYCIILIFSILYAVINQYITSIPVLVHYIIYTLLVMVVHWDENKWAAPFGALIAYATLIYLQAICLRWFSAKWLAANYELAGLVINMIVFAVVWLFHLIFKRINVDVQYNHLKWWQILMAICIALGVIAFCFVYKPILEERYYIDSYVWLCFVGAVLFAVLMLERQSGRVKNQQIIQNLQRRIDIEYGYRHDYEKQLRLLDRTGSQFAKDILDENELELCFERLPEYPQKVIGSYLIEFQQKGIAVRFDVPEPIQTWRLGLKDTVSVLGNLIENAIEAVEVLPEREKWIEFAFKRNLDDHNLQISITNPFTQRDQETSSIMNKGVSTKGPDRGYGLSIVEKRIRKYQGEFRIYTNNQVFTAVIDVPDK